MEKIKIALLTMPLYVNYGGILQAYALQSTLKKLGYDAYLVNFQYKEKNRIKYFFSALKRIIAKYLFSKNDIGYFFDEEFFLKNRKIIAQNTSKFIEKYINPKTQPIYDKKELNYIINDFKIFIVGSDQIWRPCYCDVKTYFLDFLKKESNIKRIAYAASFGVNKWEYSQKTSKECKELAQLFNAISVRESSGKELCEKYLNVTCEHLLDPTILLDKKDYADLINESPVKKENEKILLTYILDTTEEKKKLIKEIAQKKHLKIYLANNPKTESKNFPINERIAPSIEYWLNGYNIADYVITDSYHGTIFSIIFNKPFLVYSNIERGDSRFRSLLKTFHLENRLINNENELAEKLFNSTIEWEKINDILSSEKERGINFLKKNIEDI